MRVCSRARVRTLEWLLPLFLLHCLFLERNNFQPSSSEVRWQCNRCKEHHRPGPDLESRQRGPRAGSSALPGGQPHTAKVLHKKRFAARLPHLQHWHLPHTAKVLRKKRFAARLRRTQAQHHVAHDDLSGDFQVPLACRAIERACVLGCVRAQIASQAASVGADDALICALSQRASSGAVLRQACAALRNMVVRNPELRAPLLAKGAEERLRAAKSAHAKVLSDVASAALRDLGLDNYSDAAPPPVTKKPINFRPDQEMSEKWVIDRS
eukprot:354055-Chlamydomonas_euryale.AAC.1